MFFVWFGSLGFFFNVVLEIWVIEYAFFEYDTIADDEFFFEFEDVVILEGEKGVAFGWEVHGSGGAGEGMKLWVLDFGGVSDEERDGEVEAAGGGEALHNDTVK